MTAQKKILAYLDANHDAPTMEIAKATGITRRYAEATLKKMLDAKLIHVSSYVRTKAGRGSASRAFSLGIPTFYPAKPKPTPAQRARNKIAWQQKDRAQRRIIKSSRAMGPFGIVAAQVMAAT